MDLPGLLAERAPGVPAGLGGCRSRGSSYPCCDYDVYVFDGAGPDTITEYNGETASIHHCSMGESDSCALARYIDLDVISDPEWELQTMLAGVRERKDAIYSDCMRNALVSSLFCTARSRDGPFAACWVKCAAIYLADAIMLYHKVRPSPAHMLQDFHKIGGGRTGSLFSIVSECLGMERATPVLLNRMSKSAAGFSDLTEGNGRSSIILAKAGHLAEASLLADCYLYLACSVRDGMARAGTLQGRPDLSHVLRVAMDIEGDPPLLERQARMLDESARGMLSARGPLNL